VTAGGVGHPPASSPTTSVIILGIIDAITANANVRFDLRHPGQGFKRVLIHAANNLGDRPQHQQITILITGGARRCALCVRPILSTSDNSA
jgi:hypothetical protein